MTIQHRSMQDKKNSYDSISVDDDDEQVSLLNSNSNSNSNNNNNVDSHDRRRSSSSFSAMCCSNNDNNDEHTSPPRTSSRRRLYSVTATLQATLLLLGFVGAALLSVQVFLNSNADYERDYWWLGMSWRKYEAQRVANNYLKYLLEAEVTDPNDDTKKKHHHDKMEAPDGCEGTVVIVRHCEKGSIREHCSYAGYERAMYLSSIFGDNDERWPSPSYIYALATNHRKNPRKRNFREVETVQPLADKAGLPISEDYDSHSTAGLARDIFGKLRSGDLCGKVAVVAWKHSEIPHLAHKFGCGPNQGCPDDFPSDAFDLAWQIKFVYEKPYHSEFKSGWLPSHNTWEIYGSVQQEGFDPLKFSKKFGDYKPGGTTTGGRWRNFREEVPERMVFKYSKENMEREEYNN